MSCDLFTAADGRSHRQPQPSRTRTEPLVATSSRRTTPVTTTVAAPDAAGQRLGIREFYITLTTPTRPSAGLVQYNTVGVVCPGNTSRRARRTPRARFSGVTGRHGALAPPIFSPVTNNEPVIRMTSNNPLKKKKKPAVTLTHFTGNRNLSALKMSSIHNPLLVERYDQSSQNDIFAHDRRFVKSGSDTWRR